MDTKGEIIFNLSNLNLKDVQIANLASAKVDVNGNFTLLGGTYDKEGKTFKVQVTSLGNFAVVINNEPVPLSLATVKTHILLTIGDKNYNVNEDRNTMDVPPAIKDGVVYNPLRFIRKNWEKMFIEIKTQKQKQSPLRARKLTLKVMEISLKTEE